MENSGLITITMNNNSPVTISMNNALVTVTMNNDLKTITMNHRVTIAINDKSS